ncbi:MAG: hypothetical protein M3N09_10350, partial [Actinomycetota bacterium]|nr:hypothetical protein [Actinomycetota bacterium]
MDGAAGDGRDVRGKECLLSYANAILDAIETKKFGGELSEEVIRAVVEGYTEGAVPDYQM